MALGAGPGLSPSPDIASPPSGSPRTNLSYWRWMAVAMAAKTRGPKFTDELRKPIPFDLGMVVALLEYGEDKDELVNIKQAALRNLGKEWTRKLLLLLHHYEIEKSHPDAGWRLAFHLALDLVPGMQIVESVPRGRGRPKLWTRDLYRTLFAAVEKIQAEKSIGIADTIRILRKRSPDAWGKYKENTLGTRYSEARDLQLASSGALMQFISPSKKQKTRKKARINCSTF